MTTDRIKEIQSKTAYPDSVSVQQALLQVWNECEQEQLRIANVSGSISVEDTVNAFLDWMQSDDCWINDKDGKRILDAEIDGKNFMKYAEKYYR